MKAHHLKAEPRDILGRKVKHLLTSGLIPATVYGKHTNNLTVTIPSLEFVKTLKEAGETGLVQLSVQSGVHPVLIHNVQRHALSNAIQHVEFYEVNMKEKVKTNVPIEVIDESPAVTDKKVYY